MCCVTGKRTLLQACTTCTRTHQSSIASVRVHVCSATTVNTSHHGHALQLLRFIVLAVQQQHEHAISLTRVTGLWSSQARVIRSR